MAGREIEAEKETGKRKKEMKVITGKIITGLHLTVFIFQQSILKRESVERIWMTEIDKKD